MTRHYGYLAVVLSALAFVSACSSQTVTMPTPPGSSGSAPPTPPPAPTDPAPTVGIQSDTALFAFVTQTQPFSVYTPFPNLNAGADGILVASSAHQPLIRVSVNATAAAALQSGRLPRGATFPDGSVIFKEVLTNSRSVSVYAVMYKDRTNTNAGNGWLWAEYRPDGRVDYSMTNRGGACTGCHALAQGPQNDFVRIFERQR